MLHDTVPDEFTLLMQTGAHAILILSLAILRWISRLQQGERPTTHETSEA